jgi:dihydrofolate reductase
MSNDNAMDPMAFTEQIADSTTGIGLVWAQTTAGVIGKDGDMPWHLPEDMKHFTRLTSGHPVIMGRKTWLSFPDKYRPLPGRTNIVVTHQEGWGETAEAQGSMAVKSLDDALLESQFAPGHETVWVLGGGEIFAQTVDIADVAVVTFIDSETDGDTYAPELTYEWKLAASEPATGWLTSASGTRYRFTMWRRTEAK